LCAAAVTLANRGAAQAIVALTRGGSTARQLSSLRPRAPIVAVTTSEVTARRLVLHWGVHPVVIHESDVVDARGSKSGEQLVASGHATAGETAVFINVNPDLSLPDANYLRIQRL
jgi:pyruvate kinase